MALALAVWQGAAMAVGMDLLLPSPWQVARRLWTVWQEPDFFPTVAFSLLRISGGFGLIANQNAGLIEHCRGAVGKFSASKCRGIYIPHFPG